MSGSILQSLAAAPVARRAYDVAPEPYVPPGTPSMSTAGSHFAPLDTSDPTALLMLGAGIGQTEPETSRLWQLAGDAAMNFGTTTPRLARAAEQGFTIDAYKAMYPETGHSLVRRNGAWVEEGQRVPVTEFNSPGNPYAGFFSDSPEVANRFAQAFGHEAAVYPARLRFSNPVVIDAGGKPAGAFQFEALARQHGTADDMARFRGAFAEGSRHDGVILRNTADEGTVYVPRTPQQARSRFATFDPARADSGDMLASWAALGALGLGAAAGAD